jgi:hypothetical protein
MKLQIVCLSLIFFSVITITLGIIKVHTYPGKIARDRKHPQVDAIEVTSLLGLLVFPLWMAALVWAYSGAVIGTLYTADKEDSEIASPVDTPEEPALDTAEQESPSENGAVQE